MHIPNDKWVLVLENPSEYHLLNGGSAELAYVFGASLPQSNNRSGAGYIELGSDDHMLLEPGSDYLHYIGKPIGVNIYARAIGREPGALSVCIPA